MIQVTMEMLPYVNPNRIPMKHQASGELGYDIAGAAVEPPNELPNGLIVIKISFLDAKKFHRECEDVVLYEQTDDGQALNCERLTRFLGKGQDSLQALFERQTIVKSVVRVKACDNAKF